MRNWNPARMTRPLLDLPRQLADEGGFAESTARIDALVSSDQIDIIDVCLPNHLHKPVILEALRAGKSVYRENPPAGNT